jgi:hypothetical protein
LIFEGGERIMTLSPEKSPKSDATDEIDYDSILFDERIMDPVLRSRENSQRSFRIRRAHKEARVRLAIEDTVKQHKGYKTLFYGLKQNHERNVAVIHPLMYLLRRVVYALVIVFMDEITVWPVVIVMVSTLIMLAYALSEH